MPESDAIGGLTVRPVAQADSDGLSERCFADLDRDTVAGRVHEALRREERGSGLCVVAQLAGEIVGTAFLVCRERRTGHICNVFVAKEFRRQGVFRVMLQQLARWGAEAGLRRLWATVERSNETALLVYERLGFRAIRDSGETVRLERRLHKGE